MNVQQLIESIQNVAGPSGMQREVVFNAMLDIGAHSSADDFEKQIQLRFTDCAVGSKHPSKIEITLC